MALDDSLLKRWSRRGIGLFGAALAASGLDRGLQPASAGGKKGKKKKKKKKKKPDCDRPLCVDIGNVCNPSGSPCCECGVCRRNESEIFHCEEQT